ncbi:unnamed protein product [Rangifer tarandus platyrhynchus]|uniref:Uncharacterized protein n=2 Tax=Rangifer tarandus platyrhynchus TaxID=3082113 RepID=A0AC59Z0I0_RANTA|nr:unnamed protein product [Rangifer tarandus platyrhynchus]
MPGPSKGLALSQPCLESLAQFLTKLRCPLLQPPSRGGAGVEDTACYPARKVPVLQQAILPFLPSCREGIQHSGAAQPAGWAGGTFNQRGATLRAMEGPASILPALLLLTICPRKLLYALHRPTRGGLPTCLASVQTGFQGAVTQGATPFPPQGADQATSHMGGLCPRAWCPDAAPGFLNQPPQRLFLVLFLTGWCATK